MPDSKYQPGWAAMPQIDLSDKVPAGIFAVPARAPWSVKDSSLNILVDPHVMRDIDFSADRDGDVVGQNATAPTIVSPRPPPSQSSVDGGFHTGLTPIRPDPEGLRLFRNGLNGAGYVPEEADTNLLARLLYAEGSGTPQDMRALGWAIVNRVGKPEFGKTLGDVASHKNAFQSVRDNSGQWRQSAAPEALTGPAAASWRHAQDTASGILSGAISDPTDGASYFFSSSKYKYDGKVEAAPGDFARMLSQRRIFSSPYHVDGSRNFFFRENPYDK